MSEDRFLEKYRIDSARAWWHDYDGGAYFITICTENREHYFGEIEDGKMVLSEIGEYTSQCIEQITQHNPYAEIPMYVIMPNHLHLIVFIVETVHAPSQNTQNNNPTMDETVHAPSLQINASKSPAPFRSLRMCAPTERRAIRPQ